VELIRKDKEKFRSVRKIPSSGKRPLRAFYNGKQEIFTSQTFQVGTSGTRNLPSRNDVNQKAFVLIHAVDVYEHCYNFSSQ
jgi:hypothetical protein